ncbi:MAG TPA: DUF5655 domain-containing protein [Bacillota bacterium]|nr:DUF5655 domain-containing protein [Bacillota bacterium]
MRSWLEVGAWYLAAQERRVNIVNNEIRLFMDKVREMTGKGSDEIREMITTSGLTKHGEIRTYLLEKLPLGYGDANTLVHYLRKSDSASLAEGKTLEQLVDEIYDEKKATLRPIHDAVMDRLRDMGVFEILPKKGYLSLKRKRQFAMIGPKTNTRVEIGINSKTLTGGGRLIEQPKGSMCNFVVKVSDPGEVDEELMAWLKQAYDESR